MEFKSFNQRWRNRKVKKHKGAISEIQQQIPWFKRDSFAIKDGGENKYLDRIVRKPLNSDSEHIHGRVHIPVATVSKRYRLVQHRDVFKALVDALEQFVPDSQSPDATLEITEYGERMRVQFALANYELNEGDKYPLLLVVSGLNSVDTTTPLDIKLSWYEPHSQTQIPYGMMSGFRQEVNFRKKHLKNKKHLQSSDSEGIEELSKEIKQFLESYLRYLEQERDEYIKWRKAKISREQFVPWIDKTVKEKWKYKAAARTYHIAMRGYDIKPRSVHEKDERDVKPSGLGYKQQDVVPYDFAPAKNAFDVSQVLSWIASQQGTIDRQLDWTMDIPNLMEALLKQVEVLS